MSNDLERLSAALADRYTIERELGAGGMATVYLAHDLKHERKVAVKVLRPELAAVIGAERFLNEIKVTANLQHPHILPLYDSGRAVGRYGGTAVAHPAAFLYYVMPYVEGESLRDKLNREKQLSVEEATEMAKAVASALDYAHRRNVIHRDIKPENILIHDGQPVVADFGIALAVTAAGGTRLTETGLSLGTPQYMSPEQATGDREIDGRSDIYSLASVLYEMLVGDPPHTGSTVQAVIAKVVTDEPRSVMDLRKTVPVHVAAAVHMALSKLPADRFNSAADFAAALTNPAFTLPTTGPMAAVGGATAARWNRLSLGLAAALVIATMVALWGWLRPEPRPPVSRYAITFPPGQEMIGEFDIAPDGTWIVYVGPGEGEESTRLWVKPRDSYTAMPLAGTDGARGPTVSPDGRWILYVADREYRKIPSEGGPALPLTDSSTMFGNPVAWLDDGSTVVTGNMGQLLRVPASGDPAEVVFTPDSSTAAFAPQALPGSRGVLFGMAEFGETTTFSPWVLDLRSGRAKKLLDEGSAWGYLPTGHLLVRREPASATEYEAGLFAIEFDLESLTATGEQIALLETTGAFAYSRDGTLLVEVGGYSDQGQQEAVWVSRDGTVTPVDTSWKFVSHGVYDCGLALSPEGDRLAIGLFGEDGDCGVWMKELDDGPLYPLASGDGSAMRPRWTPGGGTLTFLWAPPDAVRGWDLYEKRADGLGDAEMLLAAPVDIIGEAVLTGDREYILFRTGGSAGRMGGRVAWGYRPGVDTAAFRLLTEGYDQTGLALSPDNRWLAYASSESGRYEVVVQPFPDLASGRWRVSVAGGTTPVWAHSGRELFYITPDRQFVAASVETTPTFHVIDRRVLFELGPGFVWENAYAGYDVSPDDRRFLMIRGIGDARDTEPQLVLVENWFEEVKERVGRR